MRRRTTGGTDDREAAGTRGARHGGDQPPAGLGGGGGNPRCRRQRGGRRHRRAVRAHRGRADDGRHPRRRALSSAPARRAACRARQPEPGAARHRPRDLHARPRCVAGNHGRDRAAERNRADRRRLGREPRRLVRDAGSLRHQRSGRGHGAGDPPRRARLSGHPVPRRLHRRLRGRSGPRCGDRPAVPARRAAARRRRAAGHDRLCGDVAADRARRSGRALRRRAGAAVYRSHPAPRRPSGDGGSDRIPHPGKAAGARHLSGVRDRRPAAALLGAAAHRPDAEHP